MEGLGLTVRDIDFKVSDLVLTAEALGCQAMSVRSVRGPDLAEWGFGV